MFLVLYEQTGAVSGLEVIANSLGVFISRLISEHAEQIRGNWKGKVDIEFNVHGDNIVECDRIFKYVCSGLGVSSEQIAGPVNSVTCPVYIVGFDDRRFLFRFLPGYGERRWNQDILGFIKHSGGRLREAADAILTRFENGVEKPLAAIEFCGALPAGNQAWQRHGRAFSFAHAGIPYFFVAELGGFELDANRERKAPRMPNPAAPFSFLAMTLHRNSVCLPVYEPNAGAAADTIGSYGSVFGQEQFHEFLGLAVAGITTMAAANRYLHEAYLPAFNATFKRTPKEAYSAFVALTPATNLDNILCELHERTVGRDNCVRFEGLTLQLPANRHRSHYVKVRVKVRRHMNGSLSVWHGPRLLQRYSPNGKPAREKLSNAA